MIEHFLRQFDPRDIVLVSVAIGVWLGGKRGRESLRLHGMRLGKLGSRINRVETHLQMPPPPVVPGSDEGNGE